MATTTPRKKKPLTLDDFAIMIQQDIARMATKDDLNGLAAKDDIEKVRADMRNLASRADIRELREDVQRVTEAMVSKADLEALGDELLLEIRSGKHIDELRERLAIVEDKLRIKPARGAA